MKTKEKEKQGAAAKNRKTPDWKKVTKYLRELSVVVVGIAITFIASDRISNRNAQKDLNSDLEAVKTELEDNLALIREKGDFYERTAQVALYLESHYPNRVNMDTLNLLFGDGPGNVLGNIFTLNYKNSAFEILKTSGSLRLIRNKALSRSILESYSNLESVKYNSDNYMSLKMDEVMQFKLDTEPDEETDLTDPQTKRLLRFFANYVDLEKGFEECRMQLEETLVLLGDQ